MSFDVDTWFAEGQGVMARSAAARQANAERLALIAKARGLELVGVKHKLFNMTNQLHAREAFPAVKPPPLGRYLLRSRARTRRPGPT